jgi:hypothetical protein
MAQFRPISVEHRGRRYTGSYEVKDGKICVGSAYASGECVLDDKDTDVKAQAIRLLKNIVAAQK